MIKNITNLHQEVSSFLSQLERGNFYDFNPALQGVTNHGKRISLGFSTFGLKIRYMLGEVSANDLEKTKIWSDFICSFQKNEKNYPNNFFIDDVLIDYYLKKNSEEFIKDKVKVLLNTFFNKSFDTFDTKLAKALNAETKQAISTLHQVGFEGYSSIEKPYTNDELNTYLRSLDWTHPWSAGAQFSSMCVYAKTQKFDYEDSLTNFINEIVDKETGSYFSSKPKYNREIINGAMKVLSGLDWIDQEIHYPEALINFCLENPPISEGCDIVDFVYVLFRCSQQTSYRKKEVNKTLIDIYSKIDDLYFGDQGGFSYFPKKSQTHYYGVEITNGTNCPDIHGTTLSLWAINMILKNNEMLDSKYNIIKP